MTMVRVLGVNIESPVGGHKKTPRVPRGVGIIYIAIRGRATRWTSVCPTTILSYRYAPPRSRPAPRTDRARRRPGPRHRWRPAYGRPRPRGPARPPRPLAPRWRRDRVALRRE